MQTYVDGILVDTDKATHRFQVFCRYGWIDAMDTYWRTGRFHAGLPSKRINGRYHVLFAEFYRSSADHWYRRILEAGSQKNYWDRMTAHEILDRHWHDFSEDDRKQIIELSSLAYE